MTIHGSGAVMAAVDPAGYDELPYPCAPYPQSHPEHLATLACLMGIAAPPLEGARVLEIGCGDGANLLPLAFTMPRAELVGIDLSPRQIDTGNAIVRALKLDSVRLQVRDLREIGEADGKFDYVIAHGVYSWTPPEVREALLAMLRRNLAKVGIGFVSYNVLPGWSDRLAIRSWLLEALGDKLTGAAKVEQARRLLRQLLDVLEGHASAREQSLRKEVARLLEWSDGYLRHDLLEDHNQPVHFRQFARHLEAHGLRFLAEADFPTMVGQGLPTKSAQAIQRMSRGTIEREQLFDLMGNREFRQSLVIHAEREVPRSIDPSVVQRMYVGSPAAPVGSTSASTATNRPVVKVDHPFLAACLAHLAGIWPSWIRFDELFELARRRREHHGDLIAAAEAPGLRNELATLLLACFVDRLAELHVAPPAFTLELTDRSAASPLARWQAASTDLVTNLRHDLVQLSPEARQALLLLDRRGNTGQLGKSADLLRSLARAALLIE